MNYFKLSAFLLFLSPLFISCEKDEDDDDDTNSSNQSAVIKGNIEGNMQQGNWELSKFIDSGQDETAKYSNYTFVFQNSNSLRASNQNTTYNGTWIITDSGSDDDNLSDLDFNITFSQPPLFAELNDDWDIVTYTATQLTLFDDDDAGPNDSLVFVRK
ncbi:MAG: hypothetical protein RIC95_06240 [Vicingaceae bacterium]